jgi:hypothetical protein
VPSRQIGKPKTSDSNAEKMFDAISDGFEHAPNLPIYSLQQGHAKTRRRQRVKPRNLRVLAIKKNSTQQFRGERRIPRSIERHFVFLVDLETGVAEPLRQFAVVSQKQQTFSLRIEASDVEESRKFSGQEIKDGVERVEIFSSRDESGGLM